MINKDTEARLCEKYCINQKYSSLEELCGKRNIELIENASLSEYTSFEIGGKTCTMGGIAKGSGMIHPNMATMLVFITTDCAISPEMLKKALSSDIDATFNMLSIDGDTSTNDMVTVLANGMAGNKEITEDGEDFDTFMKALNTVTVHLCRMIAGDGEGATKLLECTVSGAASEETAKTVAIIQHKNH